MLDNPKISVIMSAYNGERYLREAIESILNQTFTDFEFIIVNDGSTDNSLEIIQSYNDERIKVINNEENIGLTKSLNKALKQVTGEYIARQDADDISLPKRFEEQLRYFEKHPDTAVLGTSIYVIDENGKVLGKRIALTKPSMQELVKSNQFYHGSVIFKKAVIDHLGGYNEIFKYSQDYELWLRIAKKYPVNNLASPLYKLRSHVESVGLRNTSKHLLYHLFIQRLAKNDLDEELLKKASRNISYFYNYLNTPEKIYFHKKLAYSHLRNINLRLARSEFIKVLKLSPFYLKAVFYILITYCGENAVRKGIEMKRSFRSYVYLLIKR